ncbi:alpha/beta hydrolase [Alcanivorax sp.]|jgi:alpha-beta hydrolase superfamily lysophospholipase|uniref:alpha/beta hydrolase n=1 Tax=Alcanivorax sp. TaxID=1872427 RepID=UPI0032D92791
MKNSDNNKAPVLLVHGMWSDANTLQEVRDAFDDAGYSVESLTLPHHRSKQEHSSSSLAALASARLEDYVDAIVEAIQRQPRPPVLVGHSMGALLAQLAAAKVPCERLILLSSAAPAGINGLGVSVIRTLGRNMLRFPLWKTFTEVRLANVQYGVANSQTSEVQQDITDSCTYESGMATFQISVASLLGRRSAAHVEVSRIHCPVLIIGGTEDRITPLRVQRKIARRFGDQARLVEIQGCCHWSVGGRYFPQIRATMLDWVKAGEELAGRGRAAAA